MARYHWKVASPSGSRNVTSSSRRSRSRPLARAACSSPAGSSRRRWARRASRRSRPLWAVPMRSSADPPGRASTDPREGRREQLAWDVIERIERDDRVERFRFELERGEVAPDELGFSLRGPGAANLPPRRRRRRSAESVRRGAVLSGTPRTAAEFEHARPVLEPRRRLRPPTLGADAPTIRSRHSAKCSPMAS